MNKQSPTARGVLLMGERFKLADAPHVSTTEVKQMALMEEIFALPTHYNTLAWSLFFGYRNHVERHVPTGEWQRFERITGIAQVANRGIRQMVRYASFLPFIYHTQRPILHKVLNLLSGSM